MPDVRPAAPADLPVLATFAAQAFRDTYAVTFADLMDPADVEAYLAKAFHPGALAAEFAEPGAAFWLAEAPGGLVGYAKTLDGPAHPSVSGPRPLELARLYASAAAIGTGVGAALMRVVLDRAARDGFGTVWLGVYLQNARARAFYRRWGFEDVGTSTFNVGADVQDDAVMARPVGPVPL